MLLGFSLTGFYLLGNCIESKEGLSVLVHLVPEFLVGWLDSLHQPLQLFQGLSTGIFIPRGLS